MNREKIERTESCVLPIEIIQEEILSKLPVKSLLKFRCISKSWRRLIGSERFIKTHLQNSTKNEAFLHHRAILCFKNHKLKQSSLLPLLNEAEAANHQLSPFVDELSITPEENVIVVGCCNGLVCILKKPCFFSLVNPSTRISKELPHIGDFGQVLSSGFGWDESSDDYKVLVLHWEFSGHRVGKIYSSKTNSWKIVNYKDFYFPIELGYLFRGKLHWFGFPKWEIDTLNMKTDEFGKMELPCELDHGSCMSLGVIGGSFSLLRADEGMVEVWVMKEYEVKESWEKVIYMLPVGYEPYDVHNNSTSIGLGPNGEILLVYGPALLVYHPKDCVFRPYREISNLRGMSFYVESLVSPL